MKIINKEVFKAIFNKALRKYHKENVATKQDKLESGTNVKTINGESILGEGNLEVAGGNANLNIAALALSTTITNGKQGEEVIIGNATNDTSILIRANGAQGARWTQNILPTKPYVDNTYQKKEVGKGLSSNDFTTAEKEKLTDIPEDVASALFPSNTEKVVISSNKTSQRVELDFQSDGVEMKKIVAGGATNTKLLPTKEYVDGLKGIFVLDTANPCSYNDLQAAINAPNAIFIKHEGVFYPLVEKWENDEGAKRYVNIATLQRQGVDKGATYFFFEAAIATLDSPMAYSSTYVQPTGKPYTDSVVGQLSSLTTTDKSNIVAALNEVYEKSGEPFRVKQWANSLNVTIPTCTSDIANTSIAKTVFTIDNVEGAAYQIVGMIAYEVFDAASGGNRINCWPVCQFTGNGQKELSVRWMCGGTTDKVAKRINAWVLLKHR